MSAVQGVGVTVCYTCIAVSILSVLTPQKRTRRIMSFVIGLFFLSTLLTAVRDQVSEIDWSVSENPVAELPTYHEKDYQDVVAQKTADQLTEAVAELLLNEGIQTEDIQLTLKISEQGRISVERAVIYINENERQKTEQIKGIVYRNLAKEPQVYVKEPEVQPLAE